MYLPVENFIHEEISYEEYYTLGQMKLRPHNVERKLINGIKKKNEIQKCNIKNLISEDEALGIYV